MMITKVNEKAMAMAGRAGTFLNMDFLRKYLCLFVLTGITIIFSIITDRFFSWFNFSIIMEQGAVLMIAAMGETLIVLLGCIDLSGGSLIGLGGVLSARYSEMGVVPAFFVAAMAGMGCGAVSGVIFVKGKIPSFVATLGMMTVARGLVFLYTNGQPIPTEGEAMMQLGIGRTFGFPNITILALVIFLVIYILCYYTVFGRWIRGIGGAEGVVTVSAVPIDKVKFLAFIIFGLLAAIAGFAQASRAGSADPLTGVGQELDIIAAVVIGGTTLTGGIGNPAGTVVGAYIMATLENGLNLLGIHAYLQMLIKGVVLALAVLISIDRKRIGIMK